jgi:bacillopeptidase F
MRSVVREGRALLAGALAVLAACEASPDTLSPALEDVLRASAPDAEIPVLVTLRAPEAEVRDGHPERRVRRARQLRSLRDRARRTQEPFLAAVAALRDRSGRPLARNVRPLWIDGAVALTVRADGLRALADRPDVASVRLDAKLRLVEPIPSSAPASEWNLQVIRAPALWELGHTGSGVVVATLDTGVDLAHPALTASFRGGANSWFDPSGRHPLPQDSSGHGTQVMGVLVGGLGIGVAPGARWIAAKVFDDAGSATLGGIHLAFQWVLDPDGDPETDDAPDVVNGSWGLEGTVDRCDPEFAPDLAALREADIGVVFAAGNFGPAAETSVSPANDPGAFAVGATNEGSGVAGMSGRGPSACGDFLYPAVVAPGVNVRTADLTYGVFPDSYVTVTGTSVAAPHVAGAMALLRGAFPGATVGELERALEATAVDLDASTSGPDNVSGHGLVDVLAAHARLVALERPNLPPVARDDRASTRGRRPVTIAVLANDRDDGDALAPGSTTLVRGPRHGSVVSNGDGTFTYRADPRADRRRDTFSYTVADLAGLVSNVATVTVALHPRHPHRRR